MPKVYGLIGRQLSHSFSKKFFEQKFKSENIGDASYELFELNNPEDILNLVGSIDIRGLNVTIPYKKTIIPFLDELDIRAKRLGAVNTIKITEEKKLQGYNTDYDGFRVSLENFLKKSSMLPQQVSYALVLGTGGGSSSVCAVLSDLEIAHKRISRTPILGDLHYEDLHDKQLPENLLIVNTTPLGMSPYIEQVPDIPWEKVKPSWLFFDLIYNPAETLFLRNAKERGARTKNGEEMLYIQAEKAWKIWNRTYL